MMRSRSPRGTGSGSTAGRRGWLIVALIAFLVVDLLLVGFAIARNRTGPAEHAGPIPTFGIAPTSTPTATPPPAPTPAATVLPVAAAPRLLDAVSATEAWRATPGSCTGAGAEIDRSLDGGASWQAVTLPVAQNTQRILDLTGATDANASVVVASGAACAPNFFETQSSGQYWQPDSSQLGSVAYLDPVDGTSIHLPQGSGSAPCSDGVQTVMRSNGAAAELCGSGIYEELSGQSTWSSVPLSGALAITGTDTGYLIATAGTAGCQGISMQSLTSPIQGAQPATVGCVTQQGPPSQVTLSAAGTNVWLWTGDSVLVSTDSGANWG